MSTQRKLTQSQHETLEKIADKDEEALVIGWDSTHYGPIVEFKNNTIKVVRPTGYLGKVHHDYAR